jgi:hypothetical protein
MAKKTKSKTVKKDVKNKGKNININIHIDQSKKTTGSNAKKSNIKTLPAYSAAPSSGGNYVRQFVQDPYYSQSQYENMNLLKQYNNLVRQNNPMITSGFQDKNKNDQMLIKDSVYKTDDDKYSIDESKESITEKFIDEAMYDDPRTNGDPQNAIYNFKSQNAQKLPPTQNELPEDEDEQLLIEGYVSDPILQLMYSDKEYDDKGFKIFRQSDIKANKYFNKQTGKWVLGYGQEISKLREANQLESKFTKDPYSINLNLRDPTTDLYARNTNWRYYIKKEEKKEDEKEDENEEEEIQPKQEKPKIKKNKSTIKKVKIGKN